MKKVMMILVMAMFLAYGCAFAATTTLLDGVTAAGASSETFTVAADPTTVVMEGFTDTRAMVQIEKQNIAADAWLPYAPNGKVLYMSKDLQELIIVGRGVYRVNLLWAVTSAVSVQSLN